MENTVSFGSSSRFEKGLTLLGMGAFTIVFGGIGAILVSWIVALVGDALK